MDIGTLNLSHLKYFIDSVENQSLTVAADLNFVTRPAISQAIKKLEDWYNTDLLTHQKKKFQLTKAGEDFYPLAQSILFAISTQLAKTISDNNLKVGCSSSLLDSFFLPALSKIKRPELHLKLGPSPILRSMLEERKINLAILIDDQKMPGFITESLHSGEFILLGKTSEIIVCTEDRPEVLELKRSLRNSGHNFIQADSWGAAMKLAHALNGACLVPDFLADKKRPRVQVQNFKHSYDVKLVRRKNEFLSKAELKLCQIMTSSFKS